MATKTVKTETAPKPSLDRSALVFEDAPAPRVHRTSITKDNPFTALVAETYETKAGKSVRVPAENVGEVKYLIRAAAQELGIGSRIATATEDDGSVRVTFAGKDRKNMGARARV